MRIKLFISLLIILGLSVPLTACNQKGFTGICAANPDSYHLDIEKMNGTDTHTMELHTGDTLKIHFETEHGKLSMEIKSPDGALIYTGNGKGTTDFTVNISEGGAYSVRVEAYSAKGTIHIQQKEHT